MKSMQLQARYTLHICEEKAMYWRALQNHWKQKPKKSGREAIYLRATVAEWKLRGEVYHTHRWLQLFASQILINVLSLSNLRLGAGCSEK